MKRPNANKNRLLSVKEAAGELRLCERTVYRLLRSGLLYGRRVGRSWRIPMVVTGNSPADPKI